METLGVQPRSLILRSQLGADKHADALATLYFALFSAHPFAGGVEPTLGVGGYGRAAVTNGVALWGTISMGTLVVSTQQPIVWPAASGLWSITTPLTHWGAFSTTAGGALWYIGECDEPKAVANVGDQPRILAGGIIIAQG
jgi:hypothetical protein